MDNVPSKESRLRAVGMVEQNSRTKGKFLKQQTKNFDAFVKSVQAQYPVYSNTIDNCMGSIKNIVGELTKWAHVGLDVTDSLQLEWFKSLLKTVLRCARHGLYFAAALLKRVTNRLIDPLPNAVLSALSSATIGAALNATMVGIVAAVVILGLSLWLNVVQIKTVVLRKNPSLLDIWRKKFKSTLGGGADALPEELVPPEPQVPNVAVSLVAESQQLDESAEVLGAILFAIFLKAAIAHKFNEEIREKTQILSSLLTPTGALLGFLTTLLLVGSGGVSATLVPA